MSEENDTKQDQGPVLAAAAGWALWTPAAKKPEGWERKVLCWVVWPDSVWRDQPEPVIGWWKHGPGCFAVGDVENADHLVTHWAEIPEPNSD